MNTWYSNFASHISTITDEYRGVVTSFGAFQSYYVESLDRSPSDIAWIGSIEIFLLLFTGTITGRLTDAGYFYPVAILGSILVVLGTLMTSICTQYWQIFLAQGICVGLGNGCLFCPAVALVSTYFGKRRSLAIGITACGSGLGGIIFPLLIQELLPRVGFGWSVRIIGFIQAGSLIVAILCLKPRTTARKAGDLVEWAAFKDLKYTFYAIGCFMVSKCVCWLPQMANWSGEQLYLGSFFAFFFIAAYSRDIQGMTYTTSLRLIMVMNGVGTVGRLVLSHMADRFGTLTTFIPTAGAGAILMFSWISISSTVGLYAWTALSGIAYGGIMALFPSALAALTTDPRTQGTRIGMVFTVVSFSVLIGPPITGALLSALDGRYLGAQLFAGGSLAVGTVFLALARETERRRQGGKFQGKI